MKGAIITMLIITGIGLGQLAHAQCNIKVAGQGSQYLTQYMEPELVAQTKEIGIAMSIQKVNDRLYLAITYQFPGKAVPLEEKVAIGLKNGYTLELEMYTMDVGNAAGVELCMAVFYLQDDQMDFFVKSPLTSVQFKTQQGKAYNVPVTSNPDVLIQQIKCLRK